MEVSATDRTTKDGRHFILSFHFTLGPKTKASMMIVDDEDSPEYREHVGASLISLGESIKESAAELKQEGA